MYDDATPHDPLAPFVALFATQLTEVEDVLVTALHAYEAMHPNVSLLVYKMAAQAILSVIEQRIQERTDAWMAQKRREAEEHQ